MSQAVSVFLLILLAVSVARNMGEYSREILAGATFNHIFEDTKTKQFRDGDGGSHS